MNDMNDVSLNLLKEWFSQSVGYVEIRLLGDGDKKDIRFIAVEDLTDKLIANLIEKGEQENLNVYYSVTTRKTKSGKEADVLHVPGLWLDIDPKHATFEEAMQVVKSLPTPPTAIVSSGNGVHAYFKFNEPFEVVDENSFRFIKELSSKLHTFTNADNTQDLSRLLRVPNSMNVKNLMDVKLCSLVEFTGVTYSLDSFTYLANVEVRPVGKFGEVLKLEEPSPVEIDELNASFYIKNLIVNGAQDGEDRSKRIFHVVIELLKAEHTPEEIAFVLLNEDWAIGEKISDRQNTAKLQYIERVITNAMEVLNSEQSNMDVEQLLNRIDTNECLIYEHDNCYYEKQKRLSNFIFIPEERVHAGIDECLKGHIILNNREKLSNIVLTAKAFSSKKSFIEEINSTKISWLGDEKHLQYLKELFMTKQVIDKYAVSKIGLHNNLFITPNKVIDSKGTVTNSQYIYMPKFTEGQMDLELSMDMISSDDWRALAKEVLPLIVQVNEEAVINTIIGWHFVAPVVPLLRKYTDNAFPQLMIWGTQSAGKTSTAQLFGKLFGNPEVRSCTRPAFSITREVDLLNGVPLYLDEFRPHNMSASNWKGLKELNSLKLSGFIAGYVQWLLNKVEHDDIRLGTLYEHYKEMVDCKYDLHERPLSNIAMVLVGVSLFNELVNELQLNCTIDQHIVIDEQVKHFSDNKIHNALQNLFKHTAAIIQGNNYEFKKGTHYKYNVGQNKLIIAKDMWFPAVRKYMKDHDYVDERFSDKQIENLLKENCLQSGFVLNTSDPRNVGGKSTRSYVIDTQRLEEDMGISKDMWEQRSNF